jgi:outer membrane protein assembly factor BamB
MVKPLRWLTGLAAVLVGVWGAVLFPVAAYSDGSWLQWGGPTRDFVVRSAPLADAWPSTGPKQVWSRALGEGHSMILAEGGRLYTMYRAGRPTADSPWANEEMVIALDEKTGRTLWEHRYPARPLDFKYGAGPHATPLIVGDRLFTVGTNNQLFALDKGTGKALWSHDLVKEFGAQETLLRCPVKAGMSASPIAYGDTVIVLAGGAGQGVMAFDQRTGAVVWKSGDLNVAQASPILIDVDGETQLVVFGGLGVSGFDPRDGRLLWSHPHDTRYDMNMGTPIWDPDDNMLFITSAYDNGSRMLHLSRTEGITRVQERWHTRRMRVQFTSSIRMGNFIVGSSGDFGPTFLTAVDVETGAVLWQDRRFSRANLLLADGKLVLLDEEGMLGLARATRAGLEVLAQSQVLVSWAWTTPTLVGSNLYIRDKKTIAKLELPQP